MGAFFDDSWSKINKIYVYGFGKVAIANIDKFIDDFEVCGIIDNSEKNYGKKYRDIDVITQEEYQNIGSKEKVIILTAGTALSSIKTKLEAIGKKEYRDFCDMDTFVNEWYWQFRNQVCIGKVTTSVTTKCTFNCQYCNMLMPYYKTPQIYPVDMLKKDADALFGIVDFVTSFVIIGGGTIFTTKSQGVY